METKSFFSNDVIQRIASGNEPTQTLISLDMLENVMNPHQMRNVLGGSGDTSGTCTICCAYDNRCRVVNCYWLNQCEDMAYWLCGDSGWSTNCY